MAAKEKIDQARAMFLKNPYWKGLYEGLSPSAKGWYDLSFLFSVADEIGEDRDAVAKEAHEYEEKMSFEALVELLGVSTNGYERAKIKRLMFAAHKRENGE